MMKRTVAGFLLLSACLLFGASVWEGSAVVAGGGELPDIGYYVSTNSFPRNTIVDVKNLETDKTVRAIVAGGLNSPGLLVALSKEAAAAIGMNARGVGRVRVTMPADPIAFSRFTEGLAENPDPDRNPKAAIAAAGAETPKTVPAQTVSAQDASTPEIAATIPGAGPLPAQIPAEASVASELVQAESNVDAVTEEEVAVVDDNIKQELPVEPLQTATSEDQTDVEKTAPVTESAELVAEGEAKDSPELAPKSELPVQKALSTEPVDIPDDYVPPPALAENTEEAESEAIVEAEPVMEPAPEAEPEMVSEMAEPSEELPVIEEEPLAETETLTEAGIASAETAETAETAEVAVLEEAGSAALSVLDRLPEPSGEDALPVLDLEAPEAMDAGAIALTSPGESIDISETAEPVTDTETTVENPAQVSPGIVQAEPELVEPIKEEPAKQEPAAEVITEPIPPQPEPGTVELVLEPAEERPPEASAEIAVEAFVEPVVEASKEPQQVLAPEGADSIEASLIVEAIPPATAPALIQPLETGLPVLSDFVEPIPALPAIKPALAAVVPQVVVPVPQALAKVPEKTLEPDRKATKFKAPLVEKLEKGKYYVQLGAFGKADSVNGVLASIGEVFPATIQAGGTAEKPVYKVFVGPVNLGESGALLMRFKRSGYPDAFVKEGS